MIYRSNIFNTLHSVRETVRESAIVYRHRRANIVRRRILRLSTFENIIISNISQFPGPTSAAQRVDDVRTGSGRDDVIVGRRRHALVVVGGAAAAQRRHRIQLIQFHSRNDKTTSTISRHRRRRRRPPPPPPPPTGGSGIKPPPPPLPSVGVSHGAPPLALQLLVVRPYPSIVFVIVMKIDMHAFASCVCYVSLPDRNRTGGAATADRAQLRRRRRQGQPLAISVWIYSIVCSHVGLFRPRAQFQRSAPPVTLIVVAVVF
jgi:hypothetical protein